jgi:PBSX family phage terminase large subunit
METGTLDFKLNPNLIALCKSYNSGKAGQLLEGSSRSGKSWSCIDFIVWLCSTKVQGATINIFRETYNSFKTTLYDDFNQRLPMFGIQSPFQDIQERSMFRLFGNKINLIGADNPSKVMGSGCDFAWFNEMIHIPQSIFNQVEMRCSKFWFGDYNPERVTHWIYDNVAKRPDVGFCKTTFLDNAACPPNQRKKILGYDPGNPVNVANGTANEYLWKVFGCGERAAREGVIFTNWKKGEFDTTLPHIWGLDWGATDPFTLTKFAFTHKLKKIYAKNYVYQPISSTKLAHDLVELHAGKKDLIICDNANKMAIGDLREAGFNADPCYKEPILTRIMAINDYEIIVDNSPDFENELNNYIWLDKKANVPIDNFNHICDPMGYCFTETKRR